MPTALISKETYTSQVVKYLERQIETGALPPLTKLASVRNLAQEFNVSMNVILFALEELEKKRLIRRVERKGIFVSEMASNPERLEVLILVFGDNPERNHFVRRMLSVTSSRAAAGRLNFYTRIVTFSYDELRNHDFMHRQLEAEVAKLTQTFHSDCVLVLGPAMDRREAETCLKLPFPCLFLGNFQDGDFPGLHYNRLGFRPNYYDAAAEYAIENGFGSLKLILADILKGAHSEEAVERARNLAREAGLTFEVIRLADSRSADPKRRKQGLKDAAQAVRRNPAEKELLVFSCLDDGEELLAELDAAGWKREPGKREAAVDGHQEDFPELPGVKTCRYPADSTEAFNEYLSALLPKLAKGELTDYREDYLYPKTVR